MLQENVRKQKEEHDSIVKEYQEQMKYIRENLERSTPKYKLLKENQIELKTCQIRCMQLREKIREREKMDEQKRVIQVKIFQQQIIALAKAWIERRDYVEATSKLEALTVREREWMTKVMESTEQLKQKQKARSMKKNIFMTHIEVRVSVLNLSKNLILYNF